MLNPMEKFKRSILHLNRSLHHCNRIDRINTINRINSRLIKVTRHLKGVGGVLKLFKVPITVSWSSADSSKSVLLHLSGGKLRN